MFEDKDEKSNYKLKEVKSNKSSHKKTSIAILIIIAFIITAVFLTYTIRGKEIQSLDAHYKSRVDSLSNEINSLNEIINISDSKVAQLLSVKFQMEIEISQLTNDSNNLENNLSATQQELDLLKQGDKYSMHDPTYSEVVNFIAVDDTNTNEYVPDVFTCINFAQGVNNNAESIGIRCCVIHVEFETNAHALIGFNTIDKGMVYVEPQSDEWVENFEVGNDYWTECIVPEPGYYYEDNPDDTIEGIYLYW